MKNFKNFLIGYSGEQFVTSLNKRGSDIADKIVDRFYEERPLDCSKTCINIDELQVGIGCLSGITQDITLLTGAALYLYGIRDLFTTTCAYITATKIVTNLISLVH